MKKPSGGGTAQVAPAGRRPGAVQSRRALSGDFCENEPSRLSESLADVRIRGGSGLTGRRASSCGGTEPSIPRIGAQRIDLVRYPVCLSTAWLKWGEGAGAAG